AGLLGFVGTCRKPETAPERKSFPRLGSRQSVEVKTGKRPPLLCIYGGRTLFRVILTRRAGEGIGGKLLGRARSAPSLAHRAGMLVSARFHHLKWHWIPEMAVRAGVD